MANNGAEKKKVSAADKMIADDFREQGFEYTARYVEMFGMEAWNPAFIKGASKETEAFYKDCVEEGHPYDWYFEFPEGAVF